MKGLLLNQYYAVGNSLRNYFVISLVVASLILFSQNELLFTFAAFVPVVFMVSPALEVLKHESKSGWNKFVLTLPVKRNQVVQSHYLFFVMAMLIGVIIAVAAFGLAELVVGDTLDAYAMHWLMNGIGVSLVLGYLAYPLTYQLGTEKSDMVLMISAFAGVGLFLLSQWGYDQILGNLSPETVQGMNHEFLFSSGFLAINLVLFIISYVVTLQIYKRKEY